MRNRNASAAFAAILLMGVLSCDEQEDRVFDNPNDPRGTNYSPPSVDLLENRVVAGMRDTVTIKGLWSDPSEGSRVTTSLWKHSGFFVDTQKVVGDTVRGALAFESPGTYKVSAWVRDDRGVWSATSDTVLVDVHRYRPSVTIESLSDSVEPGDTARFVMHASDTSGTIAQYVWLHDGRTETTKDSVLKLPAESEGTRYVTGYVVDDDDNQSSQENAKVVVAYRRPAIWSTQKEDTVRAMVGATVKLAFRASDPPDDPDGKAVRYVWTADDGRKGSFKPGDSLELKDSVSKLVRVEVVAKDKDSLASDPAAVVWVRFQSKEPSISFPGNGQMIEGTTVKFRWIPGALDSSYELFVDTVEYPVRSFGKTRSDSLEASLPFGNRMCYARVVGREGGDSASSPVVAFSTPEDIAKATTLASLSVVEAEFDTAFMPLDTTYRVHVGGAVTSVTVRATGSVSDQVIVCDGLETTTSLYKSIPLTIVPLTISVTVWSQDGEQSRTYRIIVTRDVSDYVKLASLSVEGCELSPSFHPDSTSYTVAIARGDSGKITWKTANSLASVSISRDGAYASGADPYVRGVIQDTAGVLLTVERTGVLVDNIYRIRARILPGRDTRLQSLYWRYNGNFDVDSSSFMRTVGEGTDSVWVTAILREGQTMKVDGKVRESGEFGIGLKPGLNTTKIMVVAEDGVTSKEYTLLYYRTPNKNNNISQLEPIVGSLDRYFDASWLSYRVDLPYEHDTASVRASLSSEYASMRVVRMHGNDTDTVVVASGDTVPVQRLAARDSTLWRIVVLAEDTSVQKSYEVRFTRAMPDTTRQLSNMGFGSLMGSYSVHDYYDGYADTLAKASVGYNDSLFWFYASWYENWKIRSVIAEWDSGLVHHRDTLRSGYYDSLVPKAADTTRVRVTITAQDSTRQRVVRLKIYRAAPSVDSTLNWLEAKSRLGFVNQRWEYPDSVWRLDSLPWQDSVITFRPRSTDPYARRITVGGKTVGTETWLSDSIRLSTVGDTTRIPVVVTAQDTTCKRTYTVNVFRAAKRKNALIASFGASTGLLSPSVNSNDSNYMLTVASTVTSVTLAPTMSDADQATFTVDGSPTKRVITLGNVGDTTTVRIVVTAQDPSVTKSYTLRILRERNPSALYGTIIVDSTLKLVESPYLVEGGLTVGTGVTLTIEPGVRIQFKTGKSLTVKGTLKALGTVAQPIVFTRAESGNWGFIMFDTTAVNGTYDPSGEYSGGSILRNCVIEYAGSSAMENAAALYIKKRYPHLEATTIQYSQSKGLYADSLGEVHWNGLVVKGNAGTGIHAKAWKFHLRQSTISDNQRGVDITPTADFLSLTDWASFDGCAFLRNTISGDGAGMLMTIPDYYYNLGISLRNSRFEANIATGRGGGFYLNREYITSGTMEIATNVFVRNEAEEGGGVCLRHYYSESTTRNIGNEYEGNKARKVGGFYLYYYDGYISYLETLLDSANVYKGNQSTGTNGYAGGFYVNCVYAKTTVVDSRFEGNMAPASGFGAMEIASGSDSSVVANCTFIGNSGADAGAMRIGTMTRLEGNLFQSNSTTRSVATVLWENDASGRIHNNAFSGNIAPLMKGVTWATNSVVMRIKGNPVVSGNNILTNATDRLLGTGNSAANPDIDARGNWWGSVSPRLDLLLVDKNSTLDDASSYGAFDGTNWLSAQNPSAPATE